MHSPTNPAASSTCVYSLTILMEETAKGQSRRGHLEAEFKTTDALSNLYLASSTVQKHKGPSRTNVCLAEERNEWQLYLTQLAHSESSSLKIFHIC